MALALILTGMWLVFFLLICTLIYLAIGAWETSKAYAIIVALSIATICIAVGTTIAIFGGKS